MTWHVVMVTGSRAAQGVHFVTMCRRLNIHKEHAAKERRDLVIVHGGARGIDSAAARYGDADAIIALPALWARFGRAAGPRRNAMMVSMLKGLRKDGHAVHCEAFPLGKSPGTRGCAKLAREAGIWTFVTELEEENEPAEPPRRVGL